MELQPPADRPAGTPSGQDPAAKPIQRTEPGLDEMLEHIQSLAVELDSCIVRLAGTSSAGVLDRDRRIANASAAEWVRRTLEDIIATSAGIRFAVEGTRESVRAGQEKLTATG